MKLLLSLALLYLYSPIISASSYINVNGKTYQSSNNGSISVVNGIVIDGNVVSGGGVSGNKKITTTNKNLKQYSQIHIKLNADIEVIQSKNNTISITAEENIIPLITASVSNNTLLLDSKKDFWTSKGIKITLLTTDITNIIIDGSANLIMKNINQQAIKFRINGAGDIFASGVVSSLSAIIDGSGDIDLKDLKSQSAIVKIQGAGDIKVYATKKLKAEINGSGDILFKGKPEKLEKIINGSGDIDEL
jgi:hypothetical protein